MLSLGFISFNFVTQGKTFLQVWEVKAADLTISPVHRAAIGVVDPDKVFTVTFSVLAHLSFPLLFCLGNGSVSPFNFWLCFQPGIP